ncbi:MAG: hypothetical protein ACT4QE_00295 [Anaerolineales bacterium]
MTGVWLGSRFGSAAINAGTNAGVTVDFDGDARPYDCGFFLPLVMKGP